MSFRSQRSRLARLEQEESKAVPNPLYDYAGMYRIAVDGQLETSDHPLVKLYRAAEVQIEEERQLEQALYREGEN